MNELEFLEAKYYCSKCANEFTVKEAIEISGRIPRSDVPGKFIVPNSFIMVHLLCPKCKTIVTTFSVPATHEESKV